VVLFFNKNNLLHDNHHGHHGECHGSTTGSHGGARGSFFQRNQPVECVTHEKYHGMARGARGTFFTTENHGEPRVVIFFNKTNQLPMLSTESTTAWDRGTFSRFKPAKYLKTLQKIEPWHY
jgi:hypothetical protein